MATRPRKTTTTTTGTTTTTRKRTPKAAAGDAPAPAETRGALPKLVVVFGGSGFIGRRLTARLTADGWNVRVAVRRPETVGTGRPPAGGEINAVKASILSDADVGAAVAGADAVVNLVGILYESGAQSFEAVHVEGARRVAAAARHGGCGRLVHMSAIGADPAAKAAYARTKANGEAAVREAFPDAAIARPSIVFGPEDDFFNRFAGMARYSPALPLIGGGRTRFQPVYVEDLVAAISRMLTDDACKGQTYELGGPGVFSFRELMQTMLAVKKQSRFLLSVPMALAQLQGLVLQNLPKPPLTRDQVELLKTDNVASGRFPGLRELGIAPTPIEEILPSYL